MKTVCVVDTCSLIYLSEIEIGNKSLHRWLFDDFAVQFSEWVWQHEIQNHLRELGNNAKKFRPGDRSYIWDLPQTNAYERMLFAPVYRDLETSRCSRCQRPQFTKSPFTPDLDSEEDRGERHNCCVSLAIALNSSHQRLIFLTDDHLAMHDYVKPVFDIFPLGEIWSSQDLIVYIFVKHRKYIPKVQALNAIQDSIARAVKPLTQQLVSQPDNRKVQEAKEKWLRVRRDYEEKIERINSLLGHI